MANKMTKRQVIEGLLNGTIEVDSTVAVDYFNHELELLAKKSASRSGKPSAKSLECGAQRETILRILEGVDNPLSIAEIKASEPTFADFSPQKVSGLLRPLVETGVVVKTMEKRVAKFALA